MSYFTTRVGGQDRPKANAVKKFTEENLILNSGLLLPVTEHILKINPEVSSSALVPFNHPVHAVVRDKQLTIIDTRAFEDALGKRINDRAMGELIKKAQLSHVWEYEQSSYGPVMPTLSAVMAEWVANAINRRYGPEPHEYENIRIILIAYYRLLCFTRDDLQSMELADLQVIIEKTIARELRIPKVLYKEVLDSEVMESVLATTTKTGVVVLDRFLEVITIITGNKSLRFSTVAIIELVIKGSWSGAHAKEMSASAIEFPPYLLYMSLMASSVSLYKRTNIGMAVSSLRGRTDFKVLGRWAEEVGSEF